MQHVWTRLRRSYYGLILLAVLLACGTARATTYCFDATNGDNQNNCQATGLNCTGTVSACKTIAKMRDLSLVPGDRVLFKCGEIWYVGGPGASIQYLLNEEGTERGQFFDDVCENDYTIPCDDNGDCVSVGGNCILTDDIEYGHYGCTSQYTDDGGPDHSEFPIISGGELVDTSTWTRICSPGASGANLITCTSDSDTACTTGNGTGSTCTNIWKSPADQITCNPRPGSTLTAGVLRACKRPGLCDTNDPNIQDYHHYRREHGGTCNVGVDQGQACRTDAGSTGCTNPVGKLCTGDNTTVCETTDDCVVAGGTCEGTARCIDLDLTALIDNMTGQACQGTAPNKYCEYGGDPCDTAADCRVNNWACGDMYGTSGDSLYVIDWDGVGKPNDGGKLWWSSIDDLWVGQGTRWVTIRGITFELAQDRVLKFDGDQSNPSTPTTPPVKGPYNTWAEGLLFADLDARYSRVGIKTSGPCGQDGVTGTGLYNVDVLVSDVNAYGMEESGVTLEGAFPSKDVCTDPPNCVPRCNYFFHATGYEVRRFSGYDNGLTSMSGSSSVADDCIKMFYTRDAKFHRSRCLDNDGKGLNLDGTHVEYGWCDMDGDNLPDPGASVFCTSPEANCGAGTCVSTIRGEWGNVGTDIYKNYATNNDKGGIVFEYYGAHGKIHHNFIGQTCTKSAGANADINMAHGNHFQNAIYMNQLLVSRCNRGIGARVDGVGYDSEQHSELYVHNTLDLNNAQSPISTQHGLFSSNARGLFAVNNIISKIAGNARAGQTSYDNPANPYYAPPTFSLCFGQPFCMDYNAWEGNTASRKFKWLGTAAYTQDAMATTFGLETNSVEYDVNGIDFAGCYCSEDPTEFKRCMRDSDCTGACVGCSEDGKGYQPATVLPPGTDITAVVEGGSTPWNVYPYYHPDCHTSDACVGVGDPYSCCTGRYQGCTGDNEPFTCCGTVASAPGGGACDAAGVTINTAAPPIGAFAAVGPACVVTDCTSEADLHAKIALLNAGSCPDNTITFDCDGGVNPETTTPTWITVTNGTDGTGDEDRVILQNGAIIDGGTQCGVCSADTTTDLLRRRPCDGDGDCPGGTCEGLSPTPLHSCVELRFNPTCLSGPSCLVPDPGDQACPNMQGPLQGAGTLCDERPDDWILRLQGTGQIVRNLSFSNGWKGIVLANTSNITLDNLVGSYMCDDFVSTWSGAGGVTLGTLSDSILSTGCNKGIQLNNDGNTSAGVWDLTVDNTRVEDVVTPIAVIGNNRLRVQNGSWFGDSQPQATPDVHECGNGILIGQQNTNPCTTPAACTSYALFDNTTVDNCKLGIQVVDNTEIRLQNSTITNNWVVGMQCGGNTAIDKTLTSTSPAKCSLQGNTFSNNGTKNGVPQASGAAFSGGFAIHAQSSADLGDPGGSGLLIDDQYYVSTGGNTFSNNRCAIDTTRPTLDCNISGAYIDINNRTALTVTALGNTWAVANPCPQNPCSCCDQAVCTASASPPTGTGDCLIYQSAQWEDIVFGLTRITGGKLTGGKLE